MPNKKEILEDIKLIVLTGLTVFLIRYFVFQPFLVSGASMEPSFHQNNYLLIDELSYKIRDPQRGEVVILKSPQNPSGPYLIKRVIGLPNEIIKIKDGKVIIIKDGKEEILKEPYLPPQTNTSGNITVLLKEDEYFVLGDNRENSLDSRSFGPVPRKNIIGKVFFRAFPIKDFGKVE
jgi:signal peptidase I